MTVPTTRPDQHRPTASRLLAGGTALALLVLAGAADGAGPVDVDLGALDALPPATSAAPGTVRLRPPTQTKGPTKNPPAERPAPATKPAAKSSLRLTPGAPAQDTTPAPPAAAQREAIASPPAPAPAPPPAAAPPAAVPPLAALPPPAPPPAATTSPTGRILFAGGCFDLSGDAKTELDGLAKRLAGDGRLYLQLVAYAGGTGDSEARRLSLSRALAARSYLLDHGVDGKQVDVRPLGNRSEPGLPPDRVDCVVVTR
jgi:outer membrane protein OmpA-like peptidoglycan-associated protein